MASHIRLKAVFLVALLLAAEAHRVMQVTSLDARQSFSTSSRAENSTELAARRSEQGSLPIMYGLGMAMAPAATTTAVTAAATVTAPVWANVVFAGACLKGVGIFAKPIVTRIFSRSAGEVAVNVATRSGLVTEAVVKVAPWAFSATPVVGQISLGLNVALTGWQLWGLQKHLQDPAKLCDLLSKIPGSPLKENCVPGGKWGPPLPPPANISSGMSAYVTPAVALAVVTTLVLAGGGAWAWHRHSQKKAYDQAFCPRSTWDSRLWSWKDDIDIGMSKCSGYFAKAVPVECALDDVACRHLACQQACCDHKGCQAYQFNNWKSRFNWTSGMFCYLSTKRWKSTDCAPRWFGEKRTNYDPEYNVTSWFGGSHESENLENAEPEPDATWSVEAKLFHQVDGLTKVRPPSVREVASESCRAAVQDMDTSKKHQTISPHRTYDASAIQEKRELCERDQCRYACESTQYCIFYQHQKKAMSDYVAEGWDGLDSCSLGISKKLRTWRDLGADLYQHGVIDSIYKEYPYKTLENFRSNEWYGGERAEHDNVGASGGVGAGVAGCDEGEHACPSHGECVKSCQDCEGFALPGAQGTCERSATQAICDPSSWFDEYKGARLNETVCSGLTKTGLIKATVKVDEDVEMSGHELCREACCADARCVLYQVPKKYAQTRPYKKGSKMKCFLGMVDSHQAPKFKCEAGTGYEGGHLFSRGCPEGTFACPVTNDCVASCDQCSGAPFADKDATSCTHIPGEDVASEGDAKLLERQESIADDWEEDDPGSDQTEVSADTDQAHILKAEAEDEAPVELVEGSSDCVQPPCLDFEEEENETFYLADLKDKDGSDDKSAAWTMAATAEALVKITQYKDKVVRPEHRASVCSMLNIGARQCTATDDMTGCVCSFFGFRQQVCLHDHDSDKFQHAFFHSPHHLVTVFTSRGMVLFAGKGCSCEQRSKKSDFHTCTFSMMNKLPTVKLTREDSFSMKLLNEADKEHQE